MGAFVCPSRKTWLVQPSAQTAHHAAPTPDYPHHQHRRRRRHPSSLLVYTHLNKHTSILCYATACSAHKPDWGGGSWGEELTILWEDSTANRKEGHGTGDVSLDSYPCGGTASPTYYMRLSGGENQNTGESLVRVLCLHEDSESR